MLKQGQYAYVANKTLELEKRPLLRSKERQCSISKSGEGMTSL